MQRLLHAPYNVDNVHAIWISSNIPIIHVPLLSHDCEKSVTIYRHTHTHKHDRRNNEQTYTLAPKKKTHTQKERKRHRTEPSRFSAETCSRMLKLAEINESNDGCLLTRTRTSTPLKRRERARENRVEARSRLAVFPRQRNTHPVRISIHGFTASTIARAR